MEIGQQNWATVSEEQDPGIAIPEWYLDYAEPSGYDVSSESKAVELTIPYVG